MGLDIVLLGHKGGGKSSTGNTILGREEFRLGRTTQSVKAQGEVAGKKIVLVDTPGWWENTSAAHTPALVRQEMFHGLSLCPQGPHILLLVIQMDFNQKEVVAKALIDHVQMFGERIWNHCIVVVTMGDRLQDMTIEQYMERKGKSLSVLLGKCGNRYHMFNNQNPKDNAQVTELLKKMEELLIENRGQPFEIDGGISQVLEERRRINESAQRMSGATRKKITSKSLTALNIVLLGWKSAGKTSVGNTILGGEPFRSGTTPRCVKGQGRTAGRQLTVIDTPGWWRDVPSIYTPILVQQEIIQSVSLCPPGPHALLFVVCADMAFPGGFKEAVEKHLGPLGKRVWQHTIVLFTCTSSLGRMTIEHYIASEGKDLRWLIAKCRNRYHVIDNKSKGDGSQVTELLEKIEELVAVNRGRHFEVCGGLNLGQSKDEQKNRNYRVSGFQKEIDGNSLAQELRIILLGYRQSGKTTSGNSIFGRKEFSSRTADCVTRHGRVAGRDLTVVDTPGWWMSLFFSQPPGEQRKNILGGISLSTAGPQVFLLVLRLDVSFTEKERVQMEAHIAPFGETLWDHSAILFTYGDFLGDTAIEQYIRNEGKPLQWLVQKCRNRYHVFDNKNGGNGTQVAELLEKLTKMEAGLSFRRARSMDISPDMEAEHWSLTSGSDGSQDMLHPVTPSISSGYVSGSTQSVVSGGSSRLKRKKNNYFCFGIAMALHGTGEEDFLIEGHL